MVVVHRVFRREFALAPALVRAVDPGDVQQAGRVAAHLTEMCTMLHHHHTGEDDLIWPRLHERAPVSQALVMRMEQQHEVVGGLLQQLDGLVPQWGSTADTALGSRLAAVLDELSPALAQHLDEEEREVLPLVHEHLTADEWAGVAERGRESIPKSRLLVIFGAILEEASEQERAKMLSHMPPPARLVFRLVGQRKYDRETAVLRRGLSIPQQRRG